MPFIFANINNRNERKKKVYFKRSVYLITKRLHWDSFMRSMCSRWKKSRERKKLKKKKKSRQFISHGQHFNISCSSCQKLFPAESEWWREREREQNWAALWTFSIVKHRSFELHRTQVEIQSKIFCLLYCDLTGFSLSFSLCVIVFVKKLNKNYV